jgi:hypothetical protein
MHGEMRNVLKILVGKSEGMKPLGRPRHRWEDNVVTNVKEVGQDDKGINLAQDGDQWWSLVNTVMNIKVS